MPAPSKDTQNLEAENRALVTKQREARGEREPANAAELDAARQVFDDPVRGELPDPHPELAPQERSEERQPQVDPRIAKRAEIISRFRTDRNQDPDDTEANDFSRSGTPEGFDHPVPDLAPQAQEPVEEVPEDQPVPDPEPQPEAKPLPTMVKVKVRGREYEISEEEYHAAAQKALAGDSYLDEAKQRLNQADELYRDIQNRAQHPAQRSEHPAAPKEVQPGQQQPDAAVDPQHQEEDELAKAVELIQYGDPNEASQLLDKAVEKRAAKIATTVVRNTLQSQKFEDEGTRTQKVLKDFEDQHPDLAKDSRARAAIEASVFDLQREDLKAIGVDPDKLQTRSGRVTPADIAQAHLWYRTQGYSVRNPAQLLEKAHEDFLAWRTPPKGTDEPLADPNPHPQPRQRQVEVQVDRNQRRASIPQQPSRSAAPQRQQLTPTTAPQRDRSAIVADIKAQRARPRGQVLGA